MFLVLEKKSKSSQSCVHALGRKDRKNPKKITLINEAKQWTCNSMSANEGAVATRTFRVSGVCILYFVSCCSFLFFLTANKSLQQVLQAFQEVLPADTVVFSQAVSESRPLAHSLVGDDQSFCNRTKRCDPIPLQEAKISFVHISKNGGSSWIRELLKLKPAPERYPTSLDAMSEGFTKIGLYPIKENGPEHGIPFQDNLLQHAKPYYRFISLRSPRHHVWSMFSFCYYSNWGKKVSKPAFPRGNPNNDLIDFERWLDHFLDDSKEHMLLVDPKSPLDVMSPKTINPESFWLTHEILIKHLGSLSQTGPRQSTRTGIWIGLD